MDCLQALADAVPQLSPHHPPGLEAPSQQSHGNWKRRQGHGTEMQRYNSSKHGARSDQKKQPGRQQKSGWGSLSGQAAPANHQVTVREAPEGQQLRCNKCDKEFLNQRGLQQHKESVHGSKVPNNLRQLQLSSGSVENDLLPSRHKGKGQSVQKPKNTTCFTPCHAPPAVRVRCGPSTGVYPRAHGTRDVVLVPEFFCEESDMTLYDSLLKELKESGKEEEGVWSLWHGDTHVIANDQKHWKKLCPTFQAIVNKMSAYFRMDVKATRLNWYRDSKEWKPFHHDKAAFTPGCDQNCTIGASFGLSRDIAFQHSKYIGVVASFPQPNGSMYTFGKEINTEWKHGVTQLPPDQQTDEGRISIICWGNVPEETSSQ